MMFVRMMHLGSQGKGYMALASLHARLQPQQACNSRRGQDSACGQRQREGRRCTCGACPHGTHACMGRAWGQGLALDPPALAAASSKAFSWALARLRASIFARRSSAAAADAAAAVAGAPKEGMDCIVGGPPGGRRRPARRAGAKGEDEEWLLVLGRMADGGSAESRCRLLFTALGGGAEDVRSPGAPGTPRLMAVQLTGGVYPDACAVLLRLFWGVKPYLGSKYGEV